MQTDLEMLAEAIELLGLWLDGKGEYEQLYGEVYVCNHCHKEPAEEHGSECVVTRSAALVKKFREDFSG